MFYKKAGFVGISEIFFLGGTKEEQVFSMLTWENELDLNYKSNTY